MVSPRLLIVVHTKTPVQVTIAGALPGRPALAVVDAMVTNTIAHKDGSWFARLNPGTYLLRLDTDTDAPAAPLTLTTTAPVTFSTYRFEGDRAARSGPHPAGRTLRSWVGTSLHAPGDQRTPWPLPGASSSDAPCPSWVIGTVDDAATRRL